MQHSDIFIVPCRFFTDFKSDAMSIGERNCKLIQYSNSVSLHVLPYTFYMLFFTDFKSDAISIGARKCKLIQYSTNSISLCACHIYHARFLPYMFYHTHFTCSTVHVVPYMFSEIADRNWNCKGSNYLLAVLCQDLGLFTLLAVVL